MLAVQPGDFPLPNLTATRFFAPSSEVARDGIRHNHGKVAEKVGSTASEVHVANQRAWRGELTSRLGEPSQFVTRFRFNTQRAITLPERASCQPLYRKCPELTFPVSSTFTRRGTSDRDLTLYGPMELTCATGCGVPVLLRFRSA